MNNRLLVLLFLLLSSKVKAQNCTLGVNLDASSTTICSGSSVVLTAGATNGTAPYTYVWSTGETGANISVNKSGTYTVTVTDKTAGCQGVKKSISITDANTPAAPTAKSVVVCQNSSATLTATGPGGDYQWFDAPTGGNFLAGSNTFTTPPILSSTTYYVQTTVAGCTSPRTAVSVNITGKPDVAGAATCSGGSVTLLAGGGQSYSWYASAAGGTVLGTGPSFVTPPVSKTTTYYVVAVINDCTSVPTPVTAWVNPPPATPVVSNANICSGSVATLHADASAGFFQWFDVPTGGTPLISSPDYTTPVLTATKIYYVQTVLNDCISPRVPVTVTVNPIPEVPAPQTSTICYGSATTLTAATNPTGTYAWYDAATGGRLLKSGLKFTTPALTKTTTYYLENSSAAGCTSDRAPVKVIVNSFIAAPVAAGAVICSGSVISLTAKSATNGTYQWYAAPTGGSLLSSKAGFTTPALTTSTTYYVQTMVDGCTSDRTAVPVTVIPPVTAPVVPATTVCYNGSAVLTATGNGAGFTWYDSAVGGTILSSGATYVTPNLTSAATYYVESASNSCVSARTAVTVKVNSQPSPPTASNTSVCSGTSAKLTAAGDGDILWFASPTSTSPLFTGSTFNTPIISEKTTFYIQSRIGDCVSNRAPVTVSVNSADETQFLYTSGTFSPLSPNPKPIINNPSGGTFSASPAGLVFADVHTGQIDVKASAPGKYIVTLTGNGQCSSTYSAGVEIVSIFDAKFSYGGPFCQYGTNPKPMFPPNSSAGTFSASPSGLAFASTATGEINLSKTTPGTYEVTNTIYNPDGTVGSTASAKVTIDPGAKADAGPDQTIQPGETAKMAGSIDGVKGGRWSGGLGRFVDATDLTTTYIPAAGEKQVILTLTSNDPSGICGAAIDRVVINISSTLRAPIASGTTTCMGSIATVSATGPGGTYRWYSAAENGTLLSTGPNFITPVLTQTTTYYVNTTINDVTSDMTAVTVTVSEPPTAPVVSNVPACEGSHTILAATGSTGTYQWYDAPVGGTLLSIKNTYATPALIANTSYYVQAVVDGCVSARTKVDVTVSPLPVITSGSADNVCSGVPQSYTITADQSGTTFLWSRAAVAGISNTAVSNQTSVQITETLINTKADPIDVTYLITPVSNGCSGTPFNYVVTVYPSPQVTSAPTATLCNMTTGNYTITFSIPGVSSSWSRDAVPGISNQSVSGQMAGTIREILFNTTNAPVDVTYVYNYQTSNCSGPPFKWVVKVNPSVNVTSKPSGTACSGEPVDYTITSNVPSATFSWSRAAVAGISNVAVTNKTGNKIDEVLINKATYAINVPYIITPSAFGCDGVPFTYVVKVNPEVPLPDVRTNSPVCVNKTIKLNAQTISNATYTWTGPNGFKSALQNPEISATENMAGTYSLFVTVNGCSSPVVSKEVVINKLPTSDAGGNILACITDQYIQLAGEIRGGTKTGVWSKKGTNPGQFLPSDVELNAKYEPSVEDRAAGSVTLVLTSTSKDNCNIATSEMTITFGKTPGTNAGTDLEVCAKRDPIKLDGNILIPGGGKWTSSGSGTLLYPENAEGAVYTPSEDDIKNRSVKLTLTANAPGQCYTASDDMIIKFIPPPTVDAGGIRYVLKNHTITLMPTVSDENVQYLWLPDVGLNNNKIKEPVVTGDADIAYTLYVTDVRGCVNQSQTIIKVSPDITVPNTFTPNGDGFNDYWEVKGLVAYESSTVDVFNRYGERLYHSVGYGVPWDGNFNGRQLPAGTYFYIIDLKTGKPPLSGSVTILR
ncbi:gliding motility-associated C-terminal domain-containing protein [Mucilaginibacter gossypiicola]|uniref:Gliding motility-associated C-terminal domain-containing protein n=1 Tax=Mucilaginibacter gossypiicola TaxID=551995 RepID=A0A1H8GKU4_9SPHI|nr:PKD-like domain-containing protein [Mucilaginibacter gossypiicola]SEN44751.1 gliding motility-associated C-terminal domain-containing protein [Mucilaginibacter gossypiicola]